MKKIHNLESLQHEYKTLQQKRVDLERSIQHNWHDLKHQFTSGNYFFNLIKKRILVSVVKKRFLVTAKTFLLKIGGKIGRVIFSCLK